MKTYPIDNLPSGDNYIDTEGSKLTVVIFYIIFNNSRHSTRKQIFLVYLPKSVIFQVFFTLFDRYNLAIFTLIGIFSRHLSEFFFTRIELIVNFL